VGPTHRWPRLPRWPDRLRFFAVTRPLARTVKDAAPVVADIADAIPWIPRPPIRFPTTSKAAESVRGLRDWGAHRGFVAKELDADVKNFRRGDYSEACRRAARLFPLSRATLGYAIPCLLHRWRRRICPRNLARFDGCVTLPRPLGTYANPICIARLGDGVWPDVKRRIMLGTYRLAQYITTRYYVKAQPCLPCSRATRRCVPRK